MTLPVGTPGFVRMYRSPNSDLKSRRGWRPRRRRTLTCYLSLRSEESNKRHRRGGLCFYQFSIALVEEIYIRPIPALLHACKEPLQPLVFVSCGEFIQSLRSAGFVALVVIVVLIAPSNG
jgi:hypothetical protein